MIFSYIFFLASYILLTIFFILLLVDVLIRGHASPTSKKTTEVVANIIKKYKPDARTFYDMGCAHGTFSLRIKNFLPNMDVYGIDNSVLRIFCGRVQNKILKRNVCFRKEDILETNIKEADVIYTYLWHTIMNDFEEKLKKELKEGGLVITNTTLFQKWEPIAIIQQEKFNSYNFEKLYVYKKK